jgi:2-amino-4-hydroxy-6-hydroxymethyldihydropteridine diphosphokinase
MIARTAAVEAFVGLGANLDNPLQQVRQALSELDAIEHTRVVAASSLYRSVPVGYADQPDFINAVAKLQTRLLPRELLDALHVIENRHGRRRSVRNAPRTLDLDLLSYGMLVVHEEGLTLPHPRMHERAFVLLPLAEIAPEASLPGHAPISQLLAQVERSGVEKLDVA